MRLPWNGSTRLGTWEYNDPPKSDVWPTTSMVDEQMQWVETWWVIDGYGYSIILQKSQGWAASKIQDGSSGMIWYPHYQFPFETGGMTLSPPFLQHIPIYSITYITIYLLNFLQGLVATLMVWSRKSQVQPADSTSLSDQVGRKGFRGEPTLLLKIWTKNPRVLGLHDPIWRFAYHIFQMGWWKTTNQKMWFIYFVLFSGWSFALFCSRFFLVMFKGTIYRIPMWWYWLCWGTPVLHSRRLQQDLWKVTFPKRKVVFQMSNHHFSGWWFQVCFMFTGGFKYVLCSPRSLGFHDPIWLAHIFQMAWNHPWDGGPSIINPIYTLYSGYFYRVPPKGTTIFPVITVPGTPNNHL